MEKCSMKEEKKEAEELVSILREKKITISTAESCTGGLIAKLITDIPGSSDVFTGSVIAYSNDIKHRILNVSEDILNTYGAVSHETVKIMAGNIRNIFKTDIAIAVSGIAGPGGETPVKKIGTVCFGFAFPDDTNTLTMQFQGSREQVRTRAAVFAIEYCLKHLLA